MAKQESTQQLLQDKDFQEISRQKNQISIVLTLCEMVLFFGFIALIAFNKPFLATKISGAITIGIPIAVGVIILSWVLTGIYVNWANKKYDVMVARLRERIGG
ncbi:MAG TPA: DUF485 domain-containing protein [Dissulfurispiraceae bacterium]|nr:DUF485 domain-containing protein [Dissulfurispiraceae bacterium]